MKTIFTLLALLSLQTVFAQDFTQIKTNEVNLSAAPARIVSVSPLCPHKTGQVSCMVVGSKVEVEVGLNSCVDGFGGYFSKFDYVDGKAILYFGAINLGNKQSSTVRCIQQATHIVSIYTPFEGEVELVNMDFAGNSNN
jgi:hypothetical protein